MSSNTTILTRDKEGVLTVWTMHEKPCFSIWEDSKAPSFSSPTGAEEEERERMLNEYLDFISNSGTTSRFIIKFHDEPAKGKINNTTPVTGSLPFRLNEMQAVTKTDAAGGGNMQLLNQLFDTKLKMFEMKYERLLEVKKEEIAALEAELDEAKNAPPPAGENLGTMGNVLKRLEENGTLNNVVDKLSGMLTDWIIGAKYKVNQTINSQPAPGIGKVDAAEPAPKRIDAAIHTLVMRYVGKHGEEKGLEECARDMGLLAQLTTDDDVFELAIKKLRQLE